MRRLAPAVPLVAMAVLAAAGTVAAQSEQRFDDVPADHEAHEAVEWAAETGLTLGYGDGTFRPDAPLSRDHAVIFMERYYDEILGADESDDFTRGDMMRLLHGMAETPPEARDGLFGDTHSTVDVPVTSIQDVDLSGAPEFRFQAVSAHSDRDLSKWPVRGWMKLICSNPYDDNEWFVRLTIQGDASLPAHYEGLNVSLDGGPVRGVETVVHGHPHNNNWRVLAGDLFVAWIAGGRTLKATTRFQGEGVTFDVSEFRLYRELLPQRCRW